MFSRIARFRVVSIVGLGVLLGLMVSPAVHPINTSRLDQPSADPRTDEETTRLGRTAAPIEVIQERYPNGKVKIRREVTRDKIGNYILHGTWKMWDAEGNEVASGQYRDNQRHGTWTRLYWRTDSELFSSMPYKEFQAPFLSQASFREGKLDGKWIVLDRQQRKISEWEYANGARHGLSTWRYPSGQLMRRVFYRDGLMEGQHQSWDRQSKLIAAETYQGGRKLAPQVELRDSGEEKWEGMVLHAQFVVDAADQWWDAKPATYVRIGRDELHGRWTSWYAHQRKKSEGTFKHGVRDGQFTWWHASGQTLVSGSFKAGQPDGLWVWWHKNGQRAAEGRYIDGQPSGEWFRWREDGQLCQKTDHSCDSETTITPSGETEPPEFDASLARRLPPTRSLAEEGRRR